LASVPNHYVAGQESALISYLGGSAAKPTATPPLPSQRGLHGRPTLVDNAETLAHLALIARHGASWFRELGTPAQPGSTLVTLSGAVARAGVYEIEPGASLTSLIDAAGGSSGALAGALLGGYAGSWVAPEQIARLTLENGALAPHGASLGAGVVVLLSAQACPVRESARLARWLAAQSARQCGPCLNGLDALADALEQIASGRSAVDVRQHIARVERLASLTARRGACGHPDGAVGMILSALHAFGARFEEHLRHGPCERCASDPQLVLPHRPVLDRGHARAARRR
jgi:NADH:ubiquinone oxidoreductase subunit F (NADH-binding)